MIFDVANLLNLQCDQVQQWHEAPFQAPTGLELLALVTWENHYNFELWHQEDLARDPEASDCQIAQVKRRIDRLNQQRNDHIEKIDEVLLQKLSHVMRISEARLHGETPGSMIDRLSINALKLYHMHEQTLRPEAEASHRQKCQQKLEVLQEQRQDLGQCLQELWHDLQTGTRYFKVYRQFKMYNDATLNPVLYQKARHDGG